jgi:hypothetical protein
MPTAEAVMTTQEVANRLSELFKTFQWGQIHDELFSADAQSIEPPGSPGLQTVKGIDKIREKGRQFDAMVEEMHGGFVGDPIVAGKYIAVTMGMDVTMKGQGRMKMDEIALYKVEDGKIVSEQFFY